jgi:site-specific recombinase XerD
VPLTGRYDNPLADFIATQQKDRWLSTATCKCASWQIKRFLAYIQQIDRSLGDLTSADIDGYFKHMAQRWNRSSLRTSAKMLRAWFAYCEGRGWVRRGLVAAILLPRIYQHEGLPLGPTWEQVGHMLEETTGDNPQQIRNHAILLLLAVYALRSGEVRRLSLDDIDWRQDRIRIVRSKSGRKETLPLEPRTGNAIARYLRHGRPKRDSRVVFLTLHAPPRPLSAGALYHIVKRHLKKAASPNKGRGPHGLRHACARHLLESGRSFKEAGDHLGHRNPSATRIYAKVNLKSLRRVVLDDLGGLI